MKDFPSNRKNWSVLKRARIASKWTHWYSERRRLLFFTFVSCTRCAPLPYQIHEKKIYWLKHIFAQPFLSGAIQRQLKLAILLNVIWLLSQNSSWKTMFKCLFSFAKFKTEFLAAEYREFSLNIDQVNHGLPTAWSICFLKTNIKYHIMRWQTEINYFLTIVA